MKQTQKQETKVTVKLDAKCVSALSNTLKQDGVVATAIAQQTSLYKLASEAFNNAYSSKAEASEAYDAICFKLAGISDNGEKQKEMKAEVKWRKKKSEILTTAFPDSPEKVSAVNEAKKDGLTFALQYEAAKGNYVKSKKGEWKKVEKVPDSAGNTSKGGGRQKTTAQKVETAALLFLTACETLKATPAEVIKGFTAATNSSDKYGKLILELEK